MSRPLTIWELSALEARDWVYTVDMDDGKSKYRRLLRVEGNRVIFDNGRYSAESYGDDWVAYKNKEQAESQINNALYDKLPLLKTLIYEIEHGDIVKLPFMRRRGNTDDWEVVSIHPDGFTQVHVFSHRISAELELERLQKRR